MQQLLSAYHGPHIPLDIAGSYEWFPKKPRSLLPGCPQALLSRGGWWLWGTGGHKLGRKGQLLLSPSQLLPRGNEGPVSPGQLVFPEKLEIKIFFFCLKSLHLKSCQLIQNFWKHCVGQQMCRPSQISLQASFGLRPASLYLLLYIRNSPEFKNAYHSKWLGDIYHGLCTFFWRKLLNKAVWTQILNNKTCHCSPLVLQGKVTFWQRFSLLNNYFHIM